MATLPLGSTGTPPRRRTDESLVPGTRSRGFWLYLVPGLVLFTAIILVPFVWNVYLSFTKYRGIKPPEFTGLDNWQKLLGDEQFWISFQNSIYMIIAMVVVPTMAMIM